MLKKTITYVGYDDQERTEDFYFNLTKAEIAEMELSTEGGLTQLLTRMAAAKDGRSMIKFFKEFILKTYGEKSPDGRRFIKSEELSQEFCQTEAYSQLFMELMTEKDAMAKFVRGVIPTDIAEVASQDTTQLVLAPAT